MQNTFASSSFLPAALSNQTTVLKSDHNLYAAIETDSTHFSQLYSLLFVSTAQPVKQTEVQQPLSEPDEYSSYE